MPMGGDWYLRAFPVWFARRGNFGILLSQAKALSAAARLRGDSSAIDLAQRQAQWIVGRNPFVQSTMYGEGYDWAQQYSVSSGDFVGAMPVGMQSRGDTDLPYWPSQNMYVYKEVWVHPVARWLWMMADLLAPKAAPSGMSVTSTGAANGQITIRLTTPASSARTFELRSDGLVVSGAPTVTRRNLNAPFTFEWKARVKDASVPWVAVVVPDRDVSQRYEVASR
jgi:hypothetical protein